MFKQKFVDTCVDVVEEFCPGFRASVLYTDALSPLDLEQIFGLYKGNIFHGAMGIQQVLYSRPVPGYSGYRTPIKGLYMASAGCHPGGGVMGAVGHNCAQVVISDKFKYSVLSPI